MLKIDEIAYNNALAKANPYGKCALGFGMLLLAISIPSYWLLGGITLFMCSLLLIKAKIPVKFYIKLLSIPVGFLVLSTLMILISYAREVEQFVCYLSIGKGYIGITRQGMETASYLLLRCFASINCIYFVSLTVGMNQQIKVMKRIHLPKEMIELVILMYRFIFIFLEEVQEMKLAQEIRLGYCNIKVSYRSTGLLISSLFGRMMKKYKALCIALEIKLYDGTFY